MESLNATQHLKLIQLFDGQKYFANTSADTLSHFPFLLQFFVVLNRLRRHCISNKEISDNDYENVQFVRERMKLNTLGDLHHHYVLTDVVLLVDVMERFRDMCMVNYSLDCLQYYTSPGLSYDAAIKMTNVSLDLIIDPIMYNMFE